MAMAPKNPTATRILAVGGGKGGVGKSIVSSNLSVAMAQAGQTVVLIDTDLGAANLHTMFGLIRPERSLLDFLSKKVDNLIDAGVPTMVPNLTLIPGSGAVPGAANIHYAQKQKLLRHIRTLDADVVVVDVGAGTSYNVVDLFDVADIRLVVITPQVPAMVNAYGFIKAAVYRVLTRIAKDAKREEVVSGGSGGGETERVADVLDRAKRVDPSLAQKMKAALTYFGARLVGNQLYVDKDLRQIHAVSRMAKDFLSLEAPVMGSLWRSQTVHDSVTRREPYMVQGGSDGNVRALRRMAEIALNADVQALRRGREWAEVVLDIPPTEETEIPESAQHVENYMRNAARHQVQWTATLKVDTGEQQVLIRDVSMNGALVEGAINVKVGTQGTLVFDDIVGQPTLPVEVRNVQGFAQQFGLQFLEAGEIAEQVIEAARVGG